MSWEVKYVGEQHHRMVFEDSRMDVDPSEHQSHGTLGPSPMSVKQEDRSPPRKRPHSEIQPNTRPFNAHSPDPNTTQFRYGAGTPFVYQLPPQTSAHGLAPDNQSGPTRDWSKDVPVDLNFQPAVHSFSASEDVEMRDAHDQFTPKKQLREAPRAEAEEGARAEEAESLKAPEAGEGTQDGKSEASSKVGDRPIAKGGYKRIQKQRQKELNRRRNDQYPPYPHGPAKTEHTFNLNTNTTLRHSEIPAMLLGYLQFFVNASVVVFVLYFAVQFVLTVRRDVQDKMAEASIDILQEISECSQLYLTNRCDPKYRVPAMEAPCRAWDACMSRDPTKVGRTNVLAETFAGVINSFVEPISWKTMSFSLVTLSFLIVLTNSALFNLRHRATPDVQPPPPTPQQLFPQLQAPWMSGGQHHQGYHNQGYQQTIHQGQYGQEGDHTGQAPLAIEDGSGKTKKKGWWG